MTKLEQAARQAFETWWQQEGQGFLYALNTTTDDDIKLVAEIAWKNGVYCAEQAEQEPVAIIEKEAGFETEVYATGYADSLPDGVFKLYAAPVRTKDLTDDEAQKLWNDTSSIVPMWAHHLHFARAVIAADREKNK